MGKPAAALCIVTLLVGPAAAATYDVDPVHSSISFKVRFLVTKVRGRFDKVSGSVTYEKGKPETWKAQGHAEAASVNTNVSQRDGHLRSPDFFDIKRCPDVDFKATKVTDVKDDTAKLEGLLTMRCVTKPVTLDLQIGGEAHAEGVVRLGATATGRVNRKDWGLNWNEAIEAGGMLVGDDVDMELEIEAIRRDEIPAKAEPAPKK